MSQTFIKLSCDADILTYTLYNPTITINKIEHRLSLTDPILPVNIEWYMSNILVIATHNTVYLYNIYTKSIEFSLSENNIRKAYLLKNKKLIVEKEEEIILYSEYNQIEIEYKKDKLKYSITGTTNKDNHSSSNNYNKSMEYIYLYCNDTLWITDNLLVILYEKKIGKVKDFYIFKNKVYTLKNNIIRGKDLYLDINDLFKDRECKNNKNITVEKMKQMEQVRYSNCLDRKNSTVEDKEIQSCINENENSINENLKDKKDFNRTTDKNEIEDPINNNIELNDTTNKSNNKDIPTGIITNDNNTNNPNGTENRNIIDKFYISKEYVYLIGNNFITICSKYNNSIIFRSRFSGYFIDAEFDTIYLYVGRLVKISIKDKERKFKFIKHSFLYEDKDGEFDISCSDEIKLI